MARGGRGTGGRAFAALSLTSAVPQMLANVQTIKDIDEKIAQWKAKIKVLETEEETDADLLERAASLEKDAGSRLIREMGTILKAVNKIQEELYADSTGTMLAAMGQEAGAGAGAGAGCVRGPSLSVPPPLASPPLPHARALILRTSDPETAGAGGMDPAERFKEVRVVHGVNSCVFPVTPSDTFGSLLSKCALGQCGVVWCGVGPQHDPPSRACTAAIVYWSLDPTQHVLVDGKDHVWPSELLVQVTLAESEDTVVRGGVWEGGGRGG